MKILFMGTPDFASEILDALAKTEHQIVGVVSQPDKPKGRGHKLIPTDVKLKAMELGLEVFQPETMKGEAFLPQLESLNPDMIIVAAYGKILPDYIIDFPKFGCINVHASILPKYRGAAPIQWSIINGDTETGISIMKMDYGLDTGDVISVSKTEIGEYETAGELFDRLAKSGAELLVKTIDKIENGSAQYIRQNEAESSYAQKITKEIATIDWMLPSRNISKLICAMNPFPGAITTYNNEFVKVYTSKITDGAGNPGEILAIDKGKGLKVACGEGALYLEIMQFPGSKRMNVEDYARGHNIEIGTILGR